MFTDYFLYLLGMTLFPNKDAFICFDNYHIIQAYSRYDFFICKDQTVFCFKIINCSKFDIKVFIFFKNIIDTIPRSNI